MNAILSVPRTTTAGVPRTFRDSVFNGQKTRTKFLLSWEDVQKHNSVSPRWFVIADVTKHRVELVVAAKPLSTMAHNKQ
jgi:hypothetical protein